MIRLESSIFGSLSERRRASSLAFEIRWGRFFVDMAESELQMLG